MARGTRFPRSKNVSGVTLATIPSGVTIDANAINNVSVAELEYLNGTAGYLVTYSSAGYKVSGGSSAWAGTTLNITHGMNTDLLGFGATHYNPSGVSVFQPLIFRPSPVPGAVSLTLQGMISTGAVSMAVSGGTIYWTAFGN